MSLDQSTISQIVNGLQQASISGTTTLPSRDIPQNTESFSHDPAVQVNYIPSPEPNQIDYINNENKCKNIINIYAIGLTKNRIEDKTLIMHKNTYFIIVY